MCSDPTDTVLTQYIRIITKLPENLLRLTTYLFGQRVEDNKTSHLLYVALIRSLNSLSILVTKEVEKKYNREVIKKVPRMNLIAC